MQFGLGFRQSPLILEQTAQPKARSDIFRVDLQGHSERGFRRFKISLFVNYDPKIAVEIWRAWVDLDGMSAAGESLVEPAQAYQGATEIAMQIRATGVDGEGMLVFGDRLLEPPRVLQHNAQVVTGVHVPRIEPDRLAETGLCFVQPFAL